jgi:hypothetical protein
MKGEKMKATIIALLLCSATFAIGEIAPSLQAKVLATNRQMGEWGNRQFNDGNIDRSVETTKTVEVELRNFGRGGKLLVQVLFFELNKADHPVRIGLVAETVEFSVKDLSKKITINSPPADGMEYRDVLTNQKKKNSKTSNLIAGYCVRVLEGEDLADIPSLRQTAFYSSLSKINADNIWRFLPRDMWPKEP